MDFEKRKIFEAITRHNYFPNQKRDHSEIPPCFSSKRYTPEIVQELCKVEEGKGRGGSGYDLVEYQITRHNNIPRTLGIPHPLSYAFLANSVVENWENLTHVSDNSNSAIVPELHGDGRILVMNYDDPEEKTQRTLNESFGKKFRVETDISSCFHNIYTHSIPWSLIGFEAAKKQRDQKLWFNSLDRNQRRTKRNETVGIPIGPATSSIFVEVILGKIDEKLRSKGFTFTRYIDDYICYCETHEETSSFTNALTKELRKVKLSLNLSKTKLIELPEPITEDWVIELSSLLPNTLIDDNNNRRKLTYSEALRFIDHAIKLKKYTPDGSILKYAIKSITDLIDEYYISDIADYIINLCWHYPTLLPCLENLFENEVIDVQNYEDRLNAIIIDSATHYRSDGMAWGIYYINRYKLRITTKAFELAFDTKDCITLTLLYKNGLYKSRIKAFAKELVVKSDYERDQYWLFLYELYYDKVIANPFSDYSFRILRNNDVTFLPPENTTTKAENECARVLVELVFGQAAEEAAS